VLGCTDKRTIDLNIPIRIVPATEAGSCAHPDAGIFPAKGSHVKPSASFANRVLAGLPRAEIDRLSPYLTPVNLAQGETLANGTFTHGYFLEDGIASVVVTVADGNTVEVGIIGIDGVVGLPILLGTDNIPGRTFIQIGGSGFRIDAKPLKREFERQSEFRSLLLKYVQGFLVQTAQTAVCNRLHNIEERLARWLLSCRDRMHSDQLRLTHDFLGQMLGAPRTTVTLAAGLLHRAGMIDYSRGIVTVKDRAALEGSACECYQVVRQEFQRLSLL
jgi:CRP-like cAMP-binding protein